jgi:hypothetical protein
MKTTRISDAVQRALARDRARLAAEIANERERLAAIKADPAKALRLFKRRQADRMRNLRDPNWGPARKFPNTTGHNTLTYIRAFQSMNPSTLTFSIGGVK